jgi:hypothetical protein
MQPKHQKITKYHKTEDGSIKIVQESYYEQLSQYVEEVEKPTMTSLYTFEQDILHTLTHITKDGAHRLILTIDTKNGEPCRITKKYMTIKQNYPRQ